MESKLSKKLRSLADRLREAQQKLASEKLQKTANVLVALTGLELLKRKVLGHAE